MTLAPDPAPAIAPGALPEGQLRGPAPLSDKARLLAIVEGGAFHKARAVR